MRSLHLTFILSLILLNSAGLAPADQRLSAWLGSSYVLPGEESEFWLTLTSETRPLEKPKTPDTKSISFRFLGETVLPYSTSKRIYAYRYVALSYQEGIHFIPPFSLNHEGTLLESPPLQFHVQPLPETAWFTSEVGGELRFFASTTRLPPRIPFEGEPIHVEAKLYLPSQFKVEKASIAELAREGVAAGRFDVSSVIPAGKILISNVRLKQKNYTGLTYRSSITPLTSGGISVGPGKAPVTLLARISRRGLTETVPIPIELPLPLATSTARALPLPQPEGFNNAVGTFSFRTQVTSGRIREQDPISVQLTIQGTGNLNTLAPPSFGGNTESWKAYPPHRLPLQRNGNGLTGSVTFSQTIRPKGYQPTIPPFRFVSFNPETEQYLTDYSAPIPLKTTTGWTDPGPARGLPTADDRFFTGVENILGVKTSNLFEDSPRDPISRGWHIIPGILSFLLLLQIIRSRILPLLAASKGDPDILQAIDILEKKDSDSATFLRKAGSLIEESIPEDSRDEAIREIIASRDEHCFRPDKSAPDITDFRRQEIIRHLRQRLIKHTSALILLASLVISNVEASPPPEPERNVFLQAEAAWNTKAYRLALELYQTAHENRPSSSDILYNIGNCHFKLGESGLASLYYHRALQIDPTHPEALQNLQFIQKETGAILPTATGYQNWISLVSRDTYSTALAAGLWLILLAALSLIQAHRFRRFHRACLWVGSVTALASGTVLISYPTMSGFAAHHEHVVMIHSAPVMAGSSATTPEENGDRSARNSQSLFPIAPGSLCRLIATRGEWTYIELANGLRAWVPRNTTCPVLPVSAIPERF